VSDVHARIPFIETVEDARVKGVAVPVTGKRPVVEMTADRRNVRIYCISCHHPGAFVSADMPGVIYLCDRFSACGCDCADTKGELTLPRLAL
jgi:hypothetical protein